MKLVSREKVKIFLEITVTDFDDLLDLLIEQISSRIENFVNRKLKKQEYTEYFDIKISKKYFNLLAYPIDLSEDFIVTQYDVEDAIDSDYYVYEDEGMIVYFTERSNCNEPKCMKVVYTGGFEEIYINGEDVLDVPDDLQRACLIQTSFEFRSRKDLGAITISTPDGSTSKGSTGTLLNEVQEIIKSYRNKPSTRH